MEKLASGPELIIRIFPLNLYYSNIIAKLMLVGACNNGQYLLGKNRLGDDFQLNKFILLFLRIHWKFQHFKPSKIVSANMKTFIIFTIMLITWSFAFGQDNPILFSVENRDVRLSEFEYIYTKNNGDNANYSEESLNEYLDLYTKFKLKVQKAFDMGLDTVKVLQDELETYRKQLANSYLTDKEVMNKLVEEAYGRMQKDRKVAHILALIRGQKSPKDSAAAWNKIIEVKRQLEKGASFEEMVKLNSDDRGSANSGGTLGFVTAMLPDGFYHLESTIYDLKIDEISEPVVSNWVII